MTFCFLQFLHCSFILFFADFKSVMIVVIISLDSGALYVMLIKISV